MAARQLATHNSAVHLWMQQRLSRCTPLGVALAAQPPRLFAAAPVSKHRRGPRCGMPAQLQHRGGQSGWWWSQVLRPGWEEAALQPFASHQHSQKCLHGPNRHPTPAAPWAPRAASAAAVSLPMPLVGPVITTTWPSAGPPISSRLGNPRIHNFCKRQGGPCGHANHAVFCSPALNRSISHLQAAFQGD
jgi:hypothetical protein